jgi:GNAT superfamily N-acetyltransferase
VTFELRDYRAEDKAAYLALLREAWGPGSMTEAEFDWWFDGNPAGSLRSVAVRDGQVVGVAAHSLFRMALHGEERVVSFSVHATTHRSARGQGIFPALEEKHEREATERGVAAVLAFASAPTAPIFLGPLGWTEIGRLRIWARPVLRHGESGREAGFGRQGDVAAAWPNHIVRDPQYLSWRYGASPRGYERLDSKRGFAIVWPEKRHRGRTIAVVADLVAPRAEIRGLLLEAAAAARGRWLFALPGVAQASIYASAGFVPTPRTLHFMGKPLAGKLDTDLRAWRFTLGDTDFF